MCGVCCISHLPFPCIVTAPVCCSLHLHRTPFSVLSVSRAPIHWLARWPPPIANPETQTRPQAHFSSTKHHTSITPHQPLHYPHDRSVSRQALASFDLSFHPPNSSDAPAPTNPSIRRKDGKGKKGHCRKRKENKN